MAHGSVKNCTDRVHTFTVLARFTKDRSAKILRKELVPIFTIMAHITRESGSKVINTGLEFMRHQKSRKNMRENGTRESDRAKEYS